MTTISRKFTAALLFGILAGASPLFAQADDRDDPCARQRSDRPSRCEVRTLNLPAPSDVLTVNAAPNGGIRVSGSNRGDVQVRAIVVAQAESQDVADALVRQVQVRTDGGQVRAEGPRSERDRSWSVSFEVSAPTLTNLDLRSTNGGISVADVQGRMSFSTTNGALTLARLAGDVRGRTTNGAVRVDLEGNGWHGEGLDLETTNGAVKLSIPEGYSAHLEAGTSNGGFDIDFPINVTGRIDRRISTDLGSGGAPIRVTTANGAVRIQRR